jgi:hypothetical protein
MSASSLGTFAFIALRSLRNAARLRVRRLKEPRYLIGLVLGLAYFGMIFSPAGGRRKAAKATLSALPPAFLDVQLLGFALFLFVACCAVWALRWGPPALSLTEDEIQFLFPAPLSKRSILHFALLKPQLRLLFSAAVFTYVLGRGSRSGAGFVFLFLGVWIALTAVQLHLQAMAFWKSSLGTRRGLRPAAAAALVLLAAAGLAAAGAWIWSGVQALIDLGIGRNLQGLTTAWEKLASWRAEPFPAVLLFPFRRLLAPAFARDASAFLLAVPGALALVALNYIWAAGATVSFEEATLNAAQDRARRRAAKGAGRADSLPRAGRRRIVPFRLGPSGPPEVAIVWKNFLSAGRIRLGTVAGILLLLPAAAFAAPFLAAGRGPGWVQALQACAIVVPAVAGMLAFSIPLGARFDLRRDLVRGDVLKLWPIDPVRLAAAELVVPMAYTLAALFTGFAAGLALRLGLAAAGLDAGDRVPLPLFASAGSAIVLAAPALVALMLVLQNGATLAFPAWFPPGEQRTAGLEASGVRMLAMMATLLALGVAAIPSLLLGGLVVWLGRDPLGLLVWPVAALSASIPIWGEVWGGLHLLGTLFRRFDPSVDLAP